MRRIDVNAKGRVPNGFDDLQHGVTNRWMFHSVHAGAQQFDSSNLLLKSAAFDTS
jgi:hypothetical protein